jgi:hypothetical protein
MLKVLDLFSGIGGFSLGLERTGGFETVAFCEIDPFCQKVLKKHWPDVPIYNDVRDLKCSMLSAVASHAKTSLSGVTVRGYLGQEAGCGQNLKGSSENIGQNSPSSKTWTSCLVADCPPSFPTYMRSGMMRNGIVSQLPPVAHLTRGIGFGLLPTVTVSDATVGAIVGSEDTFKTTSSGTLRRYTRNGHSSSLSLGRLIVVLTGRKLSANFARMMMGFPKNWTKLKHTETP